MTRAMSSMLCLCASASLVWLTGCAAFRQSTVDVDVNKSKPMDAKYDYSDLRTMTDEAADMLLAQGFLQREATPPIVASLGIENRTTLHIDTRAMEDTLRLKLMNTGKAQFVNTARRDTLLAEQKYHAENATPETRAAIGRQLGAKYMLTGSMVELKKQTGRQVRVSEKEEIYYQLTIEVTDLTTGLIVAAPQVERARKASRPLIGW